MMLLVIALPTAITFTTIVDAGTLTFSSDNPTPYGYTVSLLFFIVPAFVVTVWLLARPGDDIPQKAFFATLAVLLPMGFGLDLVFGNLFFFFPNEGAVLGIYVPGWDFHTMSFVKELPIEEFVFYISGFVVALLVYLWLDIFWVGRYADQDTEGIRINFVRLIGMHWPSLIGGLAIIVVLIIFTRVTTAGEAFPGYAVFLIAVPLIPTALLFEGVKKVVNWQAFSLSMFTMLIVSIVWEATLASPYEWWRYHDEQMMGVFIGAWSELPVEACFVWIMVTWTSVIFYETIHRIMLSGRNTREALFGPKKGS